MNSKIISLISLLIFLGVAECFSQRPADRESKLGIVQGSVIDRETGQSLPFVNVLLVHDDTIGRESDLSGRFIFSVVPGDFRIEASYIGYETYVSSDMDVLPGRDTMVTLEMQPSYIQTDQVVITASRKSQTLVSAPVSVAVVRSAELEAQNTSTFDEAFNNVTGVNVTRSSRANIQALSIRGASEVAGGGTGNRVLLLIDGRPALSPDSGGALWNLVPVNSIDRIEVVKGAYSSLFGSSAMGGVINVITREPTQKYMTRVNLRYGFYQKAPSFTEFDRYNDYNAIEISHSNKLANGGYLLDFSRKSDDGHREKSGFDLYNFYGKYTHRFSPTKTLKVSGNVNDIHNDTPATWISRRYAYSVAPHRMDDFQKKREYNADINYSVIRSDNLKYFSRVYYYQNDSRYSFNDNPENDTTNVNIGTSQIIDSSSINAQRWGNVTQVYFSLNDMHYMIGGVDYSFDKIVALPDTVLYGRHKAMNFGVYFQDEINFNEKWTATAGIRYDYYNILGEFDESNLSPKIAVVFKPSKKLSFRTLFAQAFRNPAIAERFIKFEQGGGLTFQPNPDLRSEKLRFSSEFGSRFSIGKKAHFDVAYFYNWYNDLISFQQIPNPRGLLLYEVININKALLQGFEINGTFTPVKNMTLRLAYTYLDASDRSDGRLNDALPYKRKHTFNLFGTYQYKNFGFHINSRYKSGIEEVFIYPGSEPQAHFLLNARLDARISDVYSAFIAIDNIGNVQYEELERYRMPGRAFTFGARFTIGGEN